MAKEIKSNYFFYHLTSLSNMESIIKNGLQPRNKISNFVDVADQEIISKRQGKGLLDYVPFHFFIHNPFDGAVMKAHNDKKFVYLCLYRSFAKDHNWKIIPRHPLAYDDDYEIFDYEEGFNKIEWGIMEKRDYSDSYNKAVCMAECLSPNVVNIDSFKFIKVKDEESKKVVEDLLKKYNKNVEIDVAPTWFL